MIFNGKPTSEITADDLRSLIRDHVEEDACLDYKACPHQRDEQGLHELVKDVSAFANAQGGYLIIGIGEQSGSPRRPGGFVNVESPESVRQRMIAICLEKIEPRLAELDIREIQVDATSVLVCRVPDGPQKPYCARPNPVSHYFWRRYEDGNKLMSVAEIRECFVGDRIYREVARLRRQIDLLTQQNHGATESTPPVSDANIFQITSESSFFTFVDTHFRQVVGDEPFFRIQATPLPINEVDLQAQISSIRPVIEHPRELRQHGFDVTPESQLERTPLGMVCSQTTYQHLRVLFNGHLEFWSYMDGFSYLLDQPIDRELPEKLICPIGFIERIENFVRLAQDLYRTIEYEGSIRFMLSFVNIRGFFLVPFANESLDYGRARNEIGRPYGPQAVAVDDLHSGPLEATTAALPGDVTWRLVREVYRLCRLGPEHIPYFDSEHHCILEEPRPGHVG